MKTKKMKTFVLGDCHGRYDALIEVLTASGFNYQNDKLISLGDICDGGKDTKKCVDELLKIKNFVLISANHDEWLKEYIKTGYTPDIWTCQGGQNTLNSYKNKKGIISIPTSHKKFFNSSVLYHVETDIDNSKILFVHGGFDPSIGVENDTMYNIIWDRELIQFAKKHIIPKWNKVFVGHTTTQSLFGNKLLNMFPVKLNNLLAIDTGAGWNGKLCLMRIDNEQYWLSNKQEPSGR